MREERIHRRPFRCALPFALALGCLGIAAGTLEAGTPGPGGLLSAFALSLPEDEPWAGPLVSIGEAGGAPPKKLARAAGGGGILGFALSETDWDAGAGFGLFGFGLMTRELMPGRRWPFPAVLAADAEFLLFPAESGISDAFLAAHALFGVDVLYRQERFSLFPYVGAGLGIETLSGSKTVGGVRISANRTWLVLPVEFGAGFSMPLSPGLHLLVRAGFSTPLNAANVSLFFRTQAGVLVEF